MIQSLKLKLKTRREPQENEIALVNIISEVYDPWIFGGGITVCK